MGIAMATAITVEVIKKRHNVVSYREVADFMAGRIIEGGSDPESFARRHSVASMLINGIISGLVALLIISLVYTLASLPPLW